MDIECRIGSRFAHEFPQCPVVFHEHEMYCGSALDYLHQRHIS